CEDAGLLLFALREEFLFALDAHLAVNILDSAGPAPALALGLDEFSPAFATLRPGGGADIARFFQFVVAIIGVAPTQEHVAENARNGDLGARIIAGLLDVDGR